VSTPKTADNTTVSHYDHAPITEALIDIQFKGPAVSPDELAALQEQEAASFPEKKPTFIASLKFDQQAGEMPAFSEHSASQMGWAFLAGDKLRVWQVRPGGFTFSRLAPYQSWEPFRDEARRLWEISQAVLKPETFTRVALRYVNRLELPLPFSDFKEYLLTVPEVAPTLPQALSNFFMQLQIPQVDIQAMLILNQQLLPQVFQGPQPTIAPVLLDIDLFKEIDLPQNEEGVWNLLEQLHSKKNETFEGCITDKTRALIR
jgi:uncharacterized protein (TIGR04255 family)